MTDMAAKNGGPGRESDRSRPGSGGLRRIAAICIVAFIALLASAGVLDVIGALQPSSGGDPCHPESSWWISTLGAQAHCARLPPNLADAAFQNADVDLTVAVTRNGQDIGLHATYRTAMPVTDPVVRFVAAGHVEHDPAQFVAALFGDIQIAGNEVAWKPPLLATKAGNGVITMAGDSASLAMPAGQSGTVAVTVQPAHRMTTTITADGLSIVGLRGITAVPTESATAVSATIPDDSGPLTVDLTQPTASISTDEPTPMVVPPKDGVLPLSEVFLANLRIFGVSALAVLPAIVLYLTARWYWRATEITPAWSRFMGVFAVAVGGYVAIVILVAVGPLETLFQRWLPALEPVVQRWWPGVLPTQWHPQPGEPVPMPGSVIVAVVLLGLFLPRLVRLLRFPDQANVDEAKVDRTRWWHGLPTLLLVAVVSVGAAVATEFWLIGITYPPSGKHWIVPGAGLGALAVVAALLLFWRQQDRRLWLLAIPVAVSLAVVAGIHNNKGAWPALARVVGLAGVGGAAIVAVGFVVLGMVKPQWRGRRVWPAACLTFPVAAGLLSYPLDRAPSPAPPPGWSDSLTLALRIVGLLGFVVAVGFVVVLRECAQQSATTDDSVARYRALGIGLAFVVLAGAYSWSGQTSLVTPVAAVAATLLLLPHGRKPNVATLRRMDDEATKQAMDQLLSASEASRVLPALRKSLQDKVVAEEITQDEMTSRLDAQRAIAYPAAAGNLALEERALGGPAGARLWDQAVRGCRWGAIFGAPWTIIAIFSALPKLPYDDPFPVLAILTSVLPLVIRWAAYGLAFGFLFPLIPGPNGYAKAYAFFGAAAVPAAANAVPGHVGVHIWIAIVLALVQLLTFMLTLGLYLDYATLRRLGRAHGFFVVHNFSSVAAWGSSVGVAVATAALTALIGGLQPFINNLVQPAPPPTTIAPATSQSAPVTPGR